MNMIYYYLRRVKMLLSLKNLIIRMKLKSCGKYISVANNARVVNGNYVIVGDNFIMDEFAEINCNPINTPPQILRL